MDELHPYDGTTRRFRHDDAEPGEGLRIASRVLGLSELPARDGVRYDLSFYSGGIGVLDQLAIALPADARRVAEVVRTLNGTSPEDAVLIPDWADDLRWVVGASEDRPIREASVQFINEHRSELQPACDLSHAIWFEPGSNVNGWTVAWLARDTLCVLAFEQG